MNWKLPFDIPLITPTLGLPLEFFSILGINRPIPLFIKDIDEQIEIIKVKKLYQFLKNILQKSMVEKESL